jgi:hypothetical protein
MREVDEVRSPPGRPGRCATHPGVARAGVCEVCGRGLCLTCAVLVRGGLVGPECLSQLVPDVPPTELVPNPIPSRGDRLVLAGLSLVLVASLFPWARFGEASGYLEAWTPHWSLLSVGAAAVGIVLLPLMARRRRTPPLEAGTFAALGIVIAAAALLHRTHPPSLSAASWAVWPAFTGGLLVLLGALRKANSVLEARRPPD